MIFVEVLSVDALCSPTFSYSAVFLLSLLPR